MVVMAKAYYHLKKYELAASIVLAYPETCVGIKTAHYWTYQPWDAAHSPWGAVDPALELRMSEYCLLETNPEVRGAGRELGIDPALYLARVRRLTTQPCDLFVDLRRSG